MLAWVRLACEVPLNPPVAVCSGNGVPAKLSPAGTV